MGRKLTILLAPLDSTSIVNTSVGLAQALSDRHHKCVFAIDSRSMADNLTAYGFVVEYVGPNGGDDTPQLPLGQLILRSGLLANQSSYESLKLSLTRLGHRHLFDRVRANKHRMEAAVARHKPDVCVVSNFVAVPPALTQSAIPWVYLNGWHPLMALNDCRTPPGQSGYAIDGDRQEWETFRQMSIHMYKKDNEKYNEWMVEKGFAPNTAGNALPHSPYLNLYVYPAELDYTDLRPLPAKWHRVDSLSRRERDDWEFKIPDNFLNTGKGGENNGKLIYFSLGSLCSANVKLMKRLVGFLGHSRHRYIVSKGLLDESYDLPGNMWGADWVPQCRVLPIVDLVITHGGNGSVTETFATGKPIVVMPLFGDQYDNAQRVHEKGYGIRLNPHTVSERELLDSIDCLLNDKDLMTRLSVAAMRVRESGSIETAIDLIESLVN